MDEEQVKEIVSELEEIVRENGDDLPDDALDLLDEISSDLENAEEKKLNISSESSKEIIEAIDKIKMVAEAPEINIPAPIVNIPAPIVNVPAPIVNVPAPIVTVKVPEIKIPKTVVNMPTEMAIKKPTWIPKKASEAIPVKLVYDDKFYKALGGVGATSIPQLPFKTADGKASAALVNEDGSIATPLPTSGSNPSETITETYVAPSLTTVIQKVISGTTYTKTIVENYTTGVTTETAWS